MCLFNCQVLKPVFVPKARRETAVERARLEKEEKEKEQKRNIEKVGLEGTERLTRGKASHFPGSSKKVEVGISTAKHRSPMYLPCVAPSIPHVLGGVLFVTMQWLRRLYIFLLIPLSCNMRQENRKRETRQLAAQVVRREEEMTENHLGDNESEGDAPDDDDDLDEVRQILDSTAAEMFRLGYVVLSDVALYL